MKNITRSTRKENSVESEKRMNSTKKIRKRVSLCIFIWRQCVQKNIRFIYFETVWYGERENWMQNTFWSAFNARSVYTHAGDENRYKRHQRIIHIPLTQFTYTESTESCGLWHTHILTHIWYWDVCASVIFAFNKSVKVSDNKFFIVALYFFVCSNLLVEFLFTYSVCEWVVCRGRSQCLNVCAECAYFCVFPQCALVCECVCVRVVCAKHDALPIQRLPFSILSFYYKCIV